MARASRTNQAILEFESELDRLTELEEDIHAIASGLWRGQAWKRDWALGTIAVSAFTAWERFVETYVIALISQSTRPRIKHELVDGLLTRGRGFLEFRTVQELIDQTGLWLELSPFSALSPDQRTVLEDLRVTRNALTHRSRSALQSFRSRFGANAEPIPWLQGMSGGVNNLQRCMDRLRSIVALLKSPP